MRPILPTIVQVLGWAFLLLGALFLVPFLLAFLVLMLLAALMEE